MAIRNRIRPFRSAEYSKIWRTISVAYFLLHFSFLFILGMMTALVIVEDGYLRVFQNVYRENFDIKTQLSWPTDSKMLLQLIYLPAKVISLLGTPDYISIRLQSTFLFYITCWIIFKGIPSTNFKLNVTLLVLFMFSPSVFVWTSLGLRESYIFFWITITWLALTKLLENNSKRHLLLLFFGINGLATTKVYLFVLVLIMATVIALFSLRYRKLKETIILLLMLYSPVFLLPGIQSELTLGAKSLIQVETTPQSTSSDLETDQNYLDPNNNNSESSLNNQNPKSFHEEMFESEINEGLTEINEGLTLKLLLEQIDDNALLRSLLTSSGILNRLNSVITDNSAERKIISKNNEFNNGSLTNLNQLFIAVIKFLILPIPFVNNGSFFINLQSIESPFIYFSYIISCCMAYTVLKRRIPKTQLFYGLCFFAFIFTIQSALIEVNLGTLVRHRPILSLAIVLICIEASSRLSSSRRSQFDVKS